MGVRRGGYPIVQDFHAFSNDANGIILGDEGMIIPLGRIKVPQQWKRNMLGIPPRHPMSTLHSSRNSNSGVGT
jgi:hypothetical protein